MRHAHRRFNFIDVLSALAACAENIDTQIFVVYLDVEIFERMGDRERARECLARAREGQERLADALPAEYRERLADHPWSQQLARLRAVP